MFYFRVGQLTNENKALDDVGCHDGRSSAERYAMDNIMKDHWNKVYSSKEARELGWHEESPESTLKLLSKCKLSNGAAILDVGAGETKLIDFLIDSGYTNITVADISDVALEKLKGRLGKEKSSSVKWVVDDLTNPKYINELKDIALWHDRAVLHFLLKESQQQTYFATLKKVVQKGGYVIISVFSLEGAKKCSGLDVVNYDQNMLSERLGNDFELIETFDYIYHMPSGNTRPFVYALFQKMG
jgi:ubiquinone/menaquinone biosynthesis C-methylase UbiE